MTIVYEDNHLIAINKTGSEIVQGDKTGDPCLADMVRDYIKERDNKPGNVFIGIPHRLDRPTSGLVIFAKTSKALSRMNEIFRNKEIKKVYRAVLTRPLEKEEGELVHYLVRNRQKNKSFANATEKKNSKEARLSYKIVGKTDSYWLVEILLHTGRHHQIRAQFSAMGSPIKGDLKYGSPRSNRNGGISLHAWRVEFTHPVKKELITITAPLPSGNPLWEAFPEEGYFV